jgi:hypothetical protein
MGRMRQGPWRSLRHMILQTALAWRQWHHWNLASQLFKVRLNKGENVLTVHILTNGNMNLAYFDFKAVHR